VLGGVRYWASPHLITLKTRTVKWYILMLFEMIFMELQIQLSKYGRHFLKPFVTSEKILKTIFLKHAL